MSAKKQYQAHSNEDDDIDLHDEQLPSTVEGGQVQLKKQFEAFEFEDIRPEMKKTQKGSYAAANSAAGTPAANTKKQRQSRLRASKLVHSAQDLEVPAEDTANQLDTAGSSNGGSTVTSVRHAAAAEAAANAAGADGQSHTQSVVFSQEQLKGTLPVLDSFVHRKILKKNGAAAEVDQNESVNKISLSSQVSTENAQPHGKGEEIEIKDERQVFAIKKIPKKTRGLFEYITQSASRYLYVKDQRMYVLRKVRKYVYTVCSERELSALFKIYENREDICELRLCFLNKARNPNEQPILKLFSFQSASLLQHFLKQLSSSVFVEGYAKSITEH